VGYGRRCLDDRRSITSGGEDLGMSVKHWYQRQLFGKVVE
jgi:hypothetical protein